MSDDVTIPPPSWCFCKGEMICEQHRRLDVVQRHYPAPLAAAPTPIASPHQPGEEEARRVLAESYNGYSAVFASAAYDRVAAWLDWHDRDEGSARPGIAADDVRTALTFARAYSTQSIEVREALEKIDAEANCNAPLWSVVRGITRAALVSLQDKSA
jgi:hypothetical protein